MKEDLLKKTMTGIIPFLEDRWEEMTPLLKVERYPGGKMLLREGETATRIYIVLKGCLRMYYIREDGREITSQFFLEGGMVASAESLFTGTPSRAYLETLEESELAVLPKNEFRKRLGNDPSLEKWFMVFLENRLIYYMNLHSSYILDPPEVRYRKLLAEQPRVVERVPQHYIATYLGVSPVHLSRIKSKIAKNLSVNNC